MMPAHPAQISPLFIAFLGATIAFVFFLLGQAILKAYETAKDHRDALVRLERLLNEQLDVIHVHTAQIRTMRGGVEAGHLLLDLPRAVPVDENVGFRLLDIDLVNRLFSLWILARRVNNDVENLRSAYWQIAAQFLGGRLPRADYIRNAIFVVDGLEKVAEALVTYKTEAEDLLARVRLHVQRKQRVPRRLVGFLTERLWATIQPPSDDEVQRELQQIAEEVRAVRSRGPATKRK
jgi:hypothetical protein